MVTLPDYIINLTTNRQPQHHPHAQAFNVEDIFKSFGFGRKGSAKRGPSNNIFEKMGFTAGFGGSASFGGTNCVESTRCANGVCTTTKTCK